MSAFRVACRLTFSSSLILACAATSRTNPPAPAAEAPANVNGDVAGLVVDARGGLPVADQRVAVGSQVVPSDEHGRFRLRDVPATYDLVIVNAERSLATVYAGLSRRDPVLVHAAEPSAKPRRSSEISGTLHGGGPYPIANALHVAFRSPLARGDVLLGGPNAPTRLGPDFGPLAVRWEGAATLEGELLSHRRESGAAPAAYCARARVALVSAQPQQVDLAYQQVPLVRRKPVSVGFPESGYEPPRLSEDYRFPGTDQVLHGGAPSLRAEYDSADMSGCGAVLCTTGHIYNPYLHSSAMACGAVTSAAVSLSLPDAPAFRAPSRRTAARVGLRFDWTEVSGAIYQLTLEDTQQSAASPTLRILTEKPTATWPDLSAFGVAFPEPLKAYRASVKALGHYSSLDQAVAARGLAWGTPERAFSSESQPLSIPVQPPLGKEEAECQYAYGTAIVCGEPLPGREAAEHYMLGAINDKLRHYPEFAAAAGIHCVRDCQSARAFVQAYEQYQRAHPGFDANEPLEAREPPPPPPDEIVQERLRGVPNTRRAPPARSTVP